MKYVMHFSILFQSSAVDVYVKDIFTFCFLCKYENLFHNFNNDFSAFLVLGLNIKGETEVLP